MSSSGPVLVGFRGLCEGLRNLQAFFPPVPRDCSALFAGGAFFSQGAVCAGGFSGFVFGGLAVGVFASAGEGLSGGAGVVVFPFVVAEVFFCIEAGFLWPVKGADMRADAGFDEVAVVFGGAVAAVGDQRVGCAAGVAFMLAGQFEGLRGFGVVAGGGFYRGDHALALVDHAVVGVAGSGGAARGAFGHAGCVGVGRADEVAVGFTAGRGGRGFVEFAFLDVVRGFDPGDGFGVRFEDTFAGGMGVDQAAVEVDFFPVDQTGFDAEAHGFHEEFFEEFAAPAFAGFGEDAVVGDFVVEAVAEEPEVIEAFGQAASVRVRCGGFH